MSQRPFVCVGKLKTITSLRFREENPGARTVSGCAPSKKVEVFVKAGSHVHFVHHDKIARFDGGVHRIGRDAVKVHDKKAQQGGDHDGQHSMAPTYWNMDLITFLHFFS